MLLKLYSLASTVVFLNRLSPVGALSTPAQNEDPPLPPVYGSRPPKYPDTDDTFCRGKLAHIDPGAWANDHYDHILQDIYERTPENGYNITVGHTERYCKKLLGPADYNKTNDEWQGPGVYHYSLYAMGNYLYERYEDRKEYYIATSVTDPNQASLGMETHCTAVLCWAGGQVASICNTDPAKTVKEHKADIGKTIFDLGDQLYADKHWIWTVRHAKIHRPPTAYRTYPVVRPCWYGAKEEKEYWLENEEASGMEYFDFIAYSGTMHKHEMPTWWVQVKRDTEAFNQKEGRVVGCKKYEEAGVESGWIENYIPKKATLEKMSRDVTNTARIPCYSWHEAPPDW